MKQIFTFFTFLILCTAEMLAQDIAIEWQNTIGGSDSDIISDLHATPDGGYIIGGYSRSNASGDKSEDQIGDFDLWVVKVDAFGVVEWENTIGGSEKDQLGNIFPSNDGNYFIIAESNSNISGDKTQNSNGLTDLWILKLDASGNILWQQTYGGNLEDRLATGSLTLDGGLILTSQSSSNISGDKTAPSKGLSDAWTLKLDENGMIEWQKSIGGSSNDRGNKIIQTPDGGYVLIADSSSPISGEKTENSFGEGDYWIVKLDAQGLVQWDNTIGGSQFDTAVDVLNTADGGYLIGGYSSSSISGDKTENNLGSSDFWVLKLNNAGVIEWDNTIGGNAIETFSEGMKQLSDGSYLVCGSSSTGVSGDKTLVSKGGSDIWILNLDALGVITGQTVIGGSFDDYANNLVLTDDGGFVIASDSYSNISEDKSEDAVGIEDYWIFKMQSVVLNVNTHLVNSEISLFPNPSEGNIKINLGNEYPNVTVRISNMLGQIISISKYDLVALIEQNINGVLGIYVVDIMFDNGRSASYNIIKH